MKVIVAGMSKTGTNSLKAALTEIGYSVYDYFENYKHLSKEWEKICLEGGNTEDFRRMYENVDAVTDIPGCYFWDEIHRAFPNSKIILTVRDTEQEWCQSMLNQIEATNNIPMWLFTHLSPTIWKLMAYGDMITIAIFGTKVRFGLFSDARCNMSLMLMTYKRHNSYVMQAAPKDKLLVYNVKEGWEPLCKFLNVDVPDKPFPHRNIRGKLNEELRTSDSLFIRGKKEAMLSISCFALLLGYGVYKLTNLNSAGYLT